MPGARRAPGHRLSALRIEARRGELAGLGAHGPALSRIADDLDAFSEAHQ